jgi:hypothetical protein
MWIGGVGARLAFAIAAADRKRDDRPDQQAGQSADPSPQEQVADQGPAGSACRRLLGGWVVHWIPLTITKSIFWYLGNYTYRHNYKNVVSASTTYQFLPAAGTRQSRELRA